MSIESIRNKHVSQYDHADKISLAVAKKRKHFYWNKNHIFFLCPISQFILLITHNNF